MNKMDELSAGIAKIHLLYQQWAKQNRLNYSELAVLYCAASLEKYTQKQIGEEWLIPKQTVSAACNALRNQGYLQFEEAFDKREKILRLTPEGKAFALPVIDKMHAMEQRVFQVLGEAETRQLLTLTRKYSLALEKVVKAE